MVALRSYAVPKEIKEFVAKGKHSKKSLAKTEFG